MLKKGLEQFGKEGQKAVTKELQQLHDMVTYLPQDPKKLTRQDKQRALQSLIFLTRKRCGRIKARACADGSKQRLNPHYKKDDAASPTVSNEAVFITAAI